MLAVEGLNLDAGQLGPVLLFSLAAQGVGYTSAAKVLPLPLNIVDVCESATHSSTLCKKAAAAGTGGAWVLRPRGMGRQ